MINSIDSEDFCRKFVDFLHDINADEHLELPQIAVMGDTSSGKSSLLSALCNVQFPANNEITTRCPARLHMEDSKDGSTSASVRIRWHHSSTHGDDSFVPRIYEGEEALLEVPKGIAEAQKYILEKSYKQVAFDIIEIHVKVPGTRDLTLIDLPGFVRTVGRNENASIKSEIMALNREYLENPRCVIIAIVEGGVDFHNSQIMSDAKEVDPETRRTIPVITKPDRVDKGAERTVVDLLEGRKTDNFVRGFHMVKCRGQSELDEGVTIAEGLVREEDYFYTHPVWRTISNRKLLGINNLRHKLADIQAEMFRNDIPKIIEEIKHLKQVNADKLASFGKNPHLHNNRRIMYNEYLNGILKRLECDIMGYFGKQYRDPQTKYFLRAQIEKYYCEFGDALRDTKLGSLLTLKVGNSVLVTHSDGHMYPGKIVKLLSATNKVLIEPVPGPQHEFTKSLFYETEYDCFSSKDSAVVTDEDNIADTDTLRWFDATSTYQFKKWSIDDPDIQNDHSVWLQELMNAHRTHCLSVFISAEVFHSIIAELVTQEWHDCCHTLLDRLQTMLIACITNIINSIVAHPSRDACRKWLLQQILSLLQHKFEDMQKLLDEMIISEYIPYANDDELFEAVNKRKYARLQRLLNACQRSYYVQYNNSQQRESAVPVANIQTVFTDFQASPYNKPVYYMQDILATYGELIVKATRDAVPKQIEAHLLRTLQTAICEALQNIEESVLEKVFIEPSAVVYGRKKCQDTLMKMERALNALQSEFR